VVGKLRIGYDDRILYGAVGGWGMHRDCDSDGRRQRRFGGGDGEFSHYDYASQRDHEPVFDPAIYRKRAGDLVGVVRNDIEWGIVYRIGRDRRGLLDYSDRHERNCVYGYRD
jgi:hypothetical protein